MMKRRVQIALAFSGGAVVFVGGLSDASDAASVFCNSSAMAALCVFIKMVLLMFRSYVAVAEGSTLGVDVWGCAFWELAGWRGRSFASQLE
jgi:hypothetical protein